MVAFNGENFKSYFTCDNICRKRGGNYNNNTNAGVFTFNHGNISGNDNNNVSFRLVKIL